MSTLAIYSENTSEPLDVVSGHAAIARRLAEVDVRFERWQADRPLRPGATEEEILDAYQLSVNSLMHRYGFRSADVISLASDHPQKMALRERFLNEHTHSDFEVRFFVEGCGLFYLHANAKVYAVLCEAGDMISVPAGMPHWFDMGENPGFRCIRLFTTPQGWIADYTDSPIAARYPTLESFQALTA